eukprot:g1994.t1
MDHLFKEVRRSERKARRDEKKRRLARARKKKRRPNVARGRQVDKPIDISKLILQLSDMSIFSEMKPEELKRLIKCFVQLDFDAGDYITREGDVGETFHVLLEGEIDVRIRDGNKEVSVNKLYPGSFFGEKALLLKKKRFASFVCISACTTLCLTRETFLQYERKFRHVKETMKASETVETVKIRNERRKQRKRAAANAKAVGLTGFISVRERWGVDCHNGKEVLVLITTMFENEKEQKRLIMEHGEIHAASLVVRFRQLMVSCVKRHKAVFVQTDGFDLQAIFNSVKDALYCAWKMCSLSNKYEESLKPNRKHFAVRIRGIGLAIGDEVCLDIEGDLHGIAVQSARHLAYRICSKSEILMTANTANHLKKFASLHRCAKLAPFRSQLMVTGSPEKNDIIHLVPINDMHNLHQRLGLFARRHDPKAPGMDQLLSGYISKKSVLCLRYSLQRDAMRYGAERAVRLKFACVNIIKPIIQRHDGVYAYQNIYIFDDAEHATACAIECAEAINEMKQVEINGITSKPALCGFGLSFSKVLVVKETNVKLGYAILDAKKLSQIAERCSGENGLAIMLSKSMHHEIFNNGSWLVARVQFEKKDKHSYSVKRKKTWRLALTPVDSGGRKNLEYIHQKDQWKKWSTRIFYKGAVLCLQLCDPNDDGYIYSDPDFLKNCTSDGEKANDERSDDDDDDDLRSAEYKKLEKGTAHFACLEIRFRQLVLPILKSHNVQFMRCEMGSITAIFENVDSAIHAAHSALVIINRQRDSLLSYHKAKWSIPIGGIGIDCFSSRKDVVAIDMENCLHGTAVFGATEAARRGARMLSSIHRDREETLDLFRPLTGRSVRMKSRRSSKKTDDNFANIAVSRYSASRHSTNVCGDANEGTRKPEILATGRVKEWFQKNSSNTRWPIDKIYFENCDSFLPRIGDKKSILNQIALSKQYLFLKGAIKCNAEMTKTSNLDCISKKVKLLARRYFIGSTKVLSAKKAIGISEDQADNNEKNKTERNEIIKHRKKKIERYKKAKNRNRINTKSGDLVLTQQLIQLQNIRTFVVLAFSLNLSNKSRFASDSLTMKYDSNTQTFRKALVQYSGNAVGMAYPLLRSAYLFESIGDALEALRSAANVLGSDTSLVNGFGIDFGEYLSVSGPDCTYGGAVQNARIFASAAANPENAENEKCCAYLSKAAYAEIVRTMPTPPSLRKKQVSLGISNRKDIVYIMYIRDVADAGDASVKSTQFSSLMKKKGKNARNKKIKKKAMRKLKMDKKQIDNRRRFVIEDFGNFENLRMKLNDKYNKRL